MPGHGQVDVSYRGLPVGSGLAIRDFGPTTAYVVEVQAPMPVGTTLEISADDGVRFAARVVHVREKTEDAPSGAMRIAVDELDETARAWWDARVTTEDPAPVAAPERVAVAREPEPEAVSEPEPEAAPVEAEAETTEAVAPAPTPAVKETRSTQMMSAVDLAEIQRMAAGASAEDFAAREAEAAAAGVTDDDDDGKKKKRKRRRKKKS